MFSAAGSDRSTELELTGAQADKTRRETWMLGPKIVKLRPENVFSDRRHFPHKLHSFLHSLFLSLKQPASHGKNPKMPEELGDPWDPWESPGSRPGNPTDKPSDASFPVQRSLFPL
ncbi:Protein of unknown function [Pyronema omphalodes CBS 100304]|uniref:Uncharacterized protein n=1 Tax=Pyronema omphalodes (strain CBS 100304) TaxID=1076935 RepID=U4L529_PYROM|nr:Protein of unknown function [Pyronema omphalodes CBS 100304]